MALIFPGEKKEDRTAKHRKEWQVALAFIQAKQTEHPAFEELFNSISQDESHLFYSQANTIKMLYDFTPIQKPQAED